jgi:hypothetical protein
MYSYVGTPSPPRRAAHALAQASMAHGCKNSYNASSTVKHNKLPSMRFGQTYLSRLLCKTVHPTATPV